VYTAASSLAPPVFYDASELFEEDVERLVQTIRDRVLRLLRRRAYLSDEGTVTVREEGEEQGLLPLLHAASIQGRIAQGSQAGAQLERMGRLSAGGGARFVPGALCAEADGFSLHAGVHVPAHDRGRLEHLCRYIARPPFAADRLTWSRQGRLLFELRKPWRDGTTHIVFEPLTFIERLAALVPPPRMHMQTYHGVLAGGSVWRDDVVALEGSSHRCHPKPDEAEPSASRRPAHRYLWPELMRRVFGFEVLQCDVCRARIRLVSMIMARSVIIRILDHLGLESDPPPIQPARAPPQLELDF